MHRRRWLVLLVVLGLTGLPVLACASPPDPLWVPGFYDDGDHDDVVLAILSAEGVRDECPPTAARSVQLVATVLLPAPGDRPLVPRPLPTSRAPPTT